MSFRASVRNLRFLIMRSPVSFTNVFTPFGRIHWEFVANDLPLFLRKKTLRNRVRANFAIAQDDE